MNNIYELIYEKKAIIDKNFSVIVNIGPGSFSGIRISLAIAKGIKIANGSKIYGYKNSNLSSGIIFFISFALSFLKIL